MVHLHTAGHRQGFWLEGVRYNWSRHSFPSTQDHEIFKPTPSVLELVDKYHHLMQAHGRGEEECT